MNTYFQVVWRKVNEIHPITIGEYVFDSDPSYSVLHSHHSSEWHLLIRNVQKRHAGIYECQISASVDLRRNVTLTVVGEFSCESVEARVGA